MNRKKIWLAVAIILLSAFLWYFDLIKYGIRQGIGQGSIIWNARPVADVIADAATPDSVREKLHFIARVRQYAVNRLGLKDTRNYQTYFDQQGKELMWVVTASEPYRLREHTWDFPIVGRVPYKGFFREDLALEEAALLKSDSMDVSVRNPDGWSTLGWFRDPILSGMLDRPSGDLASLIIHELAHATIFVADSVTFNENLASFIGDEGAKLFLEEHFGADSPELRAFVATDREYRRISDHMVKGALVLDSLYSKIEGRSADEKRRLKMQSILRIVGALDTLSLNYYRQFPQRYRERLPNNASFLSYRRYHERQTDFTSMYQLQFGSDIRRLVSHFTAMFPQD